MARPKSSAPSLRYHLSGQSVCTIDGKDFYLGKHNSPKALAKYASLIAIYQGNGLKLPSDFTDRELDNRAELLLSQSIVAQPVEQGSEPIFVRDVVACFRSLVKVKYAQNSAELHRLNQVCDEITKHEGDRIADQFGPLALQRQRQRWIDAGHSRNYCNRLTNSIVRMFKHAVSQELCDVETWQRLKSVEPLRAGQTTAPETAPVEPVSIEVVRATAAFLSPVIKAMLRIQVATGMRPSEVCKMRPCDIDRSGETWMYRPAKHKTANRGKTRAVPIVGDARDAVTDYLNRDSQAYCFSPAESMAWWQAQKRTNRKSKVQPSQVSRAISDPKKKPRDRFDAHSYRQSIQRAAKRANVPSWHPYQIRH